MCVNAGKSTLYCCSSPSELLLAHHFQDVAQAIGIGAMASLEWKQAVDEKLQKLANNIGLSLPVELYSTIVVFLITLFFLVLVARFSFKKRKSDTILLAGLSGSGKTALFYKLRDGSTHQGTVTSMEANIDRFVLHSESSKQGKAKPVRLLDFPGHMKLRAKLDDYITEAGAILFLVDAADFMSNVRANAEFLYEILSKGWVVKYKIPVLIVANKSEKVTAHTPEFIRKQLEKEIDKLRVTRTAVSDADMTSEVSIGREGEPFRFAHCVNEVAMAEASVINDLLTDVYQFIREHIGC